MCELIVFGLVILLLILIVCSHRLGYISGHCDAGGSPTDPGKEGAADGPQAAANASLMAQVQAAAQSAVHAGAANVVSALPATATQAPVTVVQNAAVTVAAAPSALPATVVQPAATAQAAPMAAPIPGLGSADPDAPVANLAQAAAIVAAQKAKAESKPKLAELSARERANLLDRDCCMYNFGPDTWYLTGQPPSVAYANWHLLQ